MSEQFITMVAAMREAQRDYFDNPSHKKLALCKKLEARVDLWLQKHTAELVQWDMWSRAVQTGEVQGAYNVGHESEAEENGGA